MEARRGTDEVTLQAALTQLRALWKRYAPVLNLIGARDAAVLERHIEEGLATARLGLRMAGPGPWVEVGAGGGLPGLVLAAAVDVPLWLIEPREKRAAFLELALGVMGRGDCRVEQARVEDLDLPPFALASARAVFDPGTWLARGFELAEVVLVHAEVGDAPAGSLDAESGGGWTVHGYRRAGST